MRTKSSPTKEKLPQTREQFQHLLYNVSHLIHADDTTARHCKSDSLITLTIYGKIIKRTDISPLAKSFSEQVKNLKKEYDCFDDFIPIMNKILSKEQINEIWWI